MWLHNANTHAYLSVWGSFPFFIKICFAISVVALAGILFAMTSIIAKKLAKKKEEQRSGLITERINEMLLSAVVMQQREDTGIITKKDFDIRPLYTLGLSAKKVKKILVNEMLNYRNYFSGTIADRVRRLYISMSLHEEAYARLYKGNWEIKVNALSELYKMGVETDHAYLLELLNNNDRYIREFARLSLMKFTKRDPLQFLRELNEPISQWEEFEIFLLFQQKNDFTLGSLEGLISLDKEPTVVSLCLQLAVYFRQWESVPLILELIQTPDLKLRAEAITALGKLEATDSAKYLIAIYPGQAHVIQLKILATLGMIRSGSYLRFLENEFISSQDFEIKKYASDAIIKLYPLSKITIDKLMGNAEALNQKILNHSLNPLLNTL